MNLEKNIAGVIGAAALLGCVSAQAQGFGAGYGPPLENMPPPIEFATSAEHYAWLLEQADGGTEHTIESCLLYTSDAADDYFWV